MKRVLHCCECDIVTHGRNESKTSFDGKEQESRLESNDHDKQSLQSTIDQLENDKKHLLNELRQVAEKLAKGEIFVCSCFCQQIFSSSFTVIAIIVNFILFRISCK